MSRDQDIELEEMFLEDQELFQTANLMRSLSAPEAPLDPVFQSDLRRKLMAEAWARHERKSGRRWWPTFGPAPRLTWAASLVGIFLIAFVVAAVLLNQQGGGLGAPASSLDGQHNVAVVVPIDINFNQPMDPASTQGAIKVEPATDLTYQWSNNNTRLTITPSSKELAPNTQYVVTVGAGAKTAAGTEVPPPKAPISFVTGGLPTPAPTPLTTPTPPAKVSNERQVAGLAPLNLLQLGQWSPDGGTFYFIGAGSQLAATGLGGGVRTLVPTGVKVFALSLDGANLAYAASGKIYRMAADGAGSPIELTTGDPTAIGFSSASASPQANPVAAGPTVVFFQSPTVYKVTSPGAVTKVLSLTDDLSALQFSPAGDRAVYWARAGSSKAVELASGQVSDRGAGLIVPVAWSPDGTRVAGADGQGVYVAAPDGKNLVRVATRDKLGVPAAQALDVSWVGSSQLLISSRTQLWSGALDGSGPVKVADGQFWQPLVSPGATTVAFMRPAGSSSSLFLVDFSLAGFVSAGALLEDGGRQVAAFMDFRVKGQPDQAGAFLDDSGRTAYDQIGGLIVTGDPKLSRAYQVTSEATSSQPVSLRFTVRLVFSSGKLEVAQSDETLTLVKDAGGRLVVHQVVATQRRPVGKGAEVVSVKVNPMALSVLLDSDLDARSVPGNVVITDPSGQPVSLKYKVVYSNRTVTVSFTAGLTPGESYRLSLLTGLKDLNGRAIVSQYDFDFDGPVG